MSEVRKMLIDTIKVGDHVQGYIHAEGPITEIRENASGLKTIWILLNGREVHLAKLHTRVEK